MQKIFIRYFLLIMAVTVGLTLAGNFFIQTIFSQRQAKDTAEAMFLEISERIESNEQQIRSLRTNLNDNYITRAKALAEIVAQNPSVLESMSELERLAKVLGVDELHFTDEKGILRWGTIPAYFGMDFNKTEQTLPFIPGITDKSFALAQDPQPNGNEGKLFQYITVARQDQPGLVQVGVVPEVLDNALANNKIDVVIANYNVGQGVDIVALDSKTGLVVADSEKHFIGKSYQSMGVSDDFFKLQKSRGFIDRDGVKRYAVYSNEGTYVMEVSFSESYLFAERRNQTITTAVSSILLGMAIILAIFILLKNKIISDMEQVNKDVKRITNGNLNIEVEAHATPEFITLSSGINEMVYSISQQMDEITSQAASLSLQASLLEERNINILASLKYARKIQKNLLPSSRPFDETFKDYSILWEPREAVGGDIYWMKRFETGAVLSVCDCTGHGTPAPF